MKTVILSLIQTLINTEKDKIKLSDTLKRIMLYLQAILNKIDDTLGANLTVPSTGNAMLDTVLTLLPMLITYIESKVKISAELQDIIDWIASIIDTVATAILAPTLAAVVEKSNTLEHIVAQSQIDAPKKEPILKASNELQTALKAHIATLPVEKAA